MKVQGDCLVYCFTRKIEVFIGGVKSSYSYEQSGDRIHNNFFKSNKPEDFEKW